MTFAELRPQVGSAKMAKESFRSVSNTFRSQSGALAGVPDGVTLRAGMPTSKAERQEPLRMEVCIEIPRGSFKKCRSSGELDFVSPFPCPFNYGFIPGLVGGDGDLLDAVVLGPRLPRGARIIVDVRGAIGFIDCDINDDKLICSHRPLYPLEHALVLLFFRFYACCKRLLNVYRRRPGRTVCEGWRDARDAIARARPRQAGDDPAADLPFETL